MKLRLLLSKNNREIFLYNINIDKLCQMSMQASNAIELILYYRKILLSSIKANA